MDRKQRATEGGNRPPPLTAEKVIAWHRGRIATRRSICALLVKIAVIILACCILFTLMFGIGVVNGEGMYPRIRDGDLVVYYRLEKNWNIGDVIAFTVDGQQQYGRIVARGGDTVDMTEDGQLVINGSVQQEEIFFETLKEGRETELPITLPEDEFFVLGDNRTDAIDSRDFGPVAVGDIEGKVITLLRRRGL
jgi:signal peptidase I